jgi:hypothetical protein
MSEVQNVVKLPTRRTRQTRALRGRPSSAQINWLRRGLDQPGGKLPLFDSNGQRIDPRTIRSCIENGWAAPWFHNPLKPDWLVCKLTSSGRAILQSG